MAGSFQTIRIDGTDYRHRSLDGHADVLERRATTRRRSPTSPRTGVGLGRRVRRPGRAPRARAPVALHPADRRARRGRPARRRGAAPTSRPRCASSRSSTGSTTRRSRSARPGLASTGSSPTRCSPAGTARSTCARSRAWSPRLSPDPPSTRAHRFAARSRSARNTMFTLARPHVTNGKHRREPPRKPGGGDTGDTRRYTCVPAERFSPRWIKATPHSCSYAAALVLLMTPGLAFFYGGLVKAKSVISMMMMSFGAIGLIGVLWVLYGYAIAFPGSEGLVAPWSIDWSRSACRACSRRPRARPTRRSPSSRSRRPSRSSPSRSSPAPSPTAPSSARG